MNTTIKVLSTVQALGVDCIVTDKQALITGFDLMKVSGIRPTSVIAPVTETLQVSTLTPTAANSTDYAITITYANKNTGNFETKTYYLSNSGTAATATTICDYFRAAINRDSATVPIAATGTTTLILTAVTGNYSQQAQFGVLSVGTGAIAIAATTPAVIGVGKGLFIKMGEATSTDLVDASYYYQVKFDYTNEMPVGSTMSASNLTNRNLLYVLSTATNVETLVGTYGTITQMLAGYAATYAAGVGTLAADDSDDLLTLATGTFPSQNIMNGDVLFQDGESTYYVVESVITTATALSNVAADNAAAAYTIIYLRKI